MRLNWPNPVVHITSNNPERKFGTGFVVFQDPSATYIVTCAHVVVDVGGRETIQAGGKPAEVVALGSNDGVSGIDLAVLKVPALENAMTFHLQNKGKEGSPFTTSGFQMYKLQPNKFTFVSRELNGILGKRIFIGSSSVSSVGAWDLKITDDFQLEPGYSGAPVIEETSGTVIGVISIREGGKKGIAISIEALEKIWPQMPLALLAPEPSSLPLFAHQQNQIFLLELISIIKEVGIEEQDVKTIYKKSVPDDILQRNIWSYPTNNENYDIYLSQVLGRLNDAFTPEHGIPPLLKFAEQFASWIKLNHRRFPEKLLLWINAFAKINDVDTQAVHAFRTELKGQQHQHKTSAHAMEPQMAHRLSLLIKLERKNGSKAFFVKAWLRDKNLFLPFPFSAKSNLFEKPYTANTISIVLHQILVDLADYDKTDEEGKTKLRIEFFLPCELFDENVDNWSADGRQPLGMLYQVVIRSSERDKVHEAFWKEKGKKLGCTIECRNRDHVHWISKPIVCDNRADIYTKVAAYLTEPHILCCGLALTPDELVSSRYKKDLFRAIVISGIPVALWPRKLPDDPQMIPIFQKKLRGLLRKQKLAHLPELLLQKRKDARKGSEIYHEGYHLALFWDEWDDFQKSPPQESKLYEAEKGTQA